MAVHHNHMTLTSFYKNDPGSSQIDYSIAECDQKCLFSEENETASRPQGAGIQEEDVSIASSNDESAAAEAVFRHLDYLIRQRIDGEIGQLRDNVHRILSEQQEEFAQAFGLHDHDNHSSSEISASHVVPQSNNFDDASSDDCQLLTEDSSDCEAAMVTQHEDEFEGEICFNCRNVLSGASASHQEEQSSDKDEEKITMNYLLRLMIASSEIASALRRKEFRI
ncbi:uncharacterized protein [Acropora muricata]|uniref:uncharacterized protein n=1 Tax=Acropora muricata TaxID=159855 RepID=UPI0034E608C4